MLRRFAILLGWMAVIWGCGVFLRLPPDWTRSVFRPGAVGVILGFSFLAIGERIRRSSMRQNRARAALWLIVAVGIMVMLSRSAFVKTMIDGRALIAGVAVVLSIGFMLLGVNLHRQKQVGVSR